MMTQKKKFFEVYVCKDENGTILYIGSGARGRHKHCNSGSSHVYELNKMHFEGKKLSVLVLSLHETREDALQKEKELILQYKPIFNIQYLSNKKLSKANKSSVTSKRFREIVKELTRGMYKTLRCKQAELFLEDVENLLRSYKITGLIDGVNLTGSFSLTNKESRYVRYTNHPDRKMSILFHSLFERDKNYIKIKENIRQKIQNELSHPL